MTNQGLWIELSITWFKMLKTGIKTDKKERIIFISNQRFQVFKLVLNQINSYMIALIRTSTDHAWTWESLMNLAKQMNSNVM